MNYPLLQVHYLQVHYDQMGQAALDPDGSGALKYTAIRITYDTNGNRIKLKKGELATWQSPTVLPMNWSGLTIFHND